MLYSRRALVLFALFGIGMFGDAGLNAQQHSFAFTYSNGSKGVIDEHGWTDTSINGTKTNISRQDLARFCEDLDYMPATAKNDDRKALEAACEISAIVVPRTSIELLSWDRFFTRLLLVSPAYTDFQRYRGLLLSTDNRGISSYDSTLLPEKLGPRDSCVIYDAASKDNGKFFLFKCKLEEPTLEVAVMRADALLTSLKNLALTEDRVAEHGSLAQNRADEQCAPNGECEDSHTFVTTLVDGRRLRIKAKPTFTRLPMPLDSRLAGHEGMITGVAPDSASIEVSIYSYPEH